MAAKTKHKPQGGNKPQDHYCKVCGEHKANEKFSGKGHAAHICKKCMSLSPAERSEEMTLNKIQGMALRYLSEAEIKWLRGKMNDQRPEIRDAARETHSIKFPHYERNILKKGLTARALEFYIHGEVWSEWGDEIPIHMRFFADNTGALRRVNYDAVVEAERDTTINIGQQKALKFLKAVLQQLNAPFWADELSDAGPDDYEDFDPYFDDDDNDDDDDEAETVTEETEPPAEPKEPIWSLRIVLNKGGERAITFYNQMHDAPQDLFWSLNDWFEPDEDELYEDDSDEDGEE